MKDKLKKVLATCNNCDCRSWIYSNYPNEAHYCSNCDSLQYFTVIKEEEQKVEKSNITSERKADAIKNRIAELSGDKTYNKKIFYNEYFSIESTDEVYCWIDDKLYINGQNNIWRICDNDDFKYLIESLYNGLKHIILSNALESEIGLPTPAKEPAHTVTTPTPVESRTQAVAAVNGGESNLPATPAPKVGVDWSKDEGTVVAAVGNATFIKEEIDHPKRYCKGGIECIDAIAAATSNLVGIQAVDTGAVIRYMWRWADKGGIRDLEKAKNYIDFLIKDIQENGIRKQ